MDKWIGRGMIGPLGATFTSTAEMSASVAPPLFFSNVLRNMNGTVWSYWQGDPSPTVEMCLRSWETQLGSSWTIRVLNGDSFHDFDIIKPRRFDDLTETMKSDVIRLSLLLLYGGVWMDASVYLSRNLDWLMEFEDHPYFGYCYHNEHIESWFIHAKAGDPSIRMWLENLNAIIDRNEESYFSVYDAFKQGVRESADFRSTYKSIPFLKACFDTKVAFYDKTRPLKRHTGHMIKFINSDRLHFDNLLLNRDRVCSLCVLMLWVTVCGAVACMMLRAKKAIRT